jgi:hypothetical protein
LWEGDIRVDPVRQRNNIPAPKDFICRELCRNKTPKALLVMVTEMRKGKSIEVVKAAHTFSTLVQIRRISDHRCLKTWDNPGTDGMFPRSRKSM